MFRNDNPLLRWASRGLEMSAVQPHIPTEVYLGFLGTTIPIHWSYHAILMVTVWFVLVPICILVIRFGKPKPTLTGLHRKVSIWHETNLVVVIFGVITSLRLRR